jgi:hypothetical protein
MLEVVRNPLPITSRDAMAMAAAPDLHPKLSAIDAKLSPAAAPELPTEKTSVEAVLLCRARLMLRDD